MSDCSSSAFEPKQRRTCGTCTHCEPCEWHCNVEENAHRWIVDIDDVGVPCKGLYYEDNPDSLPRRYERLAQVAREMYEAIKPMHDPCNEGNCLCLCDSGWPEDTCLRDFEKRLEALGVSVDDVG